MALVSAISQSIPSPKSEDYPTQHDPNHLWKPTPPAYWTNAPSAKPADTAPPDLSLAQRWKWRDRSLLVGTVSGIVDAGLLVDCVADGPVSPDAPTRENGVPRVFGKFLLKNYRHAGPVYPGDAVRTVAFPAGRFKDVDGSTRRAYDADIRDF